MILKIKNDKQVGKVSFLPFMCLWLNCFLWCTYGMIVRDYIIGEAREIGGGGN